MNTAPSTAKDTAITRKQIDDFMDAWAKNISNPAHSSPVSNTNGTGQSSAGINAGGGVTIWSIPTATSQAKMNIAVKTNIAYVVVRADSSKWLLQEQDKITPRQMINICKFITLVGEHQYNTALASSLYAGNNLKVNWSNLISNLGIEDHFILHNTLLSDDTQEYLLYDQ